jgi:hypothetical protein
MTDELFDYDDCWFGMPNTTNASVIGLNGSKKRTPRLIVEWRPIDSPSHRIVGNRAEGMKFGEEFSVGDKHRHGKNC